jgi:hypothetical protein
MSRRTKLWLSVAILAAAAGGALWLVRALPDDDDWTWDVLPDRGAGWLPDETPEPGETGL